jgi:hypothetical protein
LSGYCRSWVLLYLRVVPNLRARQPIRMSWIDGSDKTPPRQMRMVFCYSNWVIQGIDSWLAREDGCECVRENNTVDAEKIPVLLLPTPHQPGQPICRTNKNTRPQMGTLGTTEPKEDKKTV